MRSTSDGELVAISSGINQITGIEIIKRITLLSFDHTTKMYSIFNQVDMEAKGMGDVCKNFLFS